MARRSSADKPPNREASTLDFGAVKNYSPSRSLKQAVGRKVCLEAILKFAPELRMFVKITLLVVSLGKAPKSVLSVGDNGVTTFPK